MGTISLKPNDKYPLKVTEVRPKNKMINSTVDGNSYWLWNAVLVDRTGDFIQVEIRSLGKDHCGFEPNEAIYQYVEVVYLSAKQTPTVQACEPPGTAQRPASPLNAAQNIVKDLPATALGGNPLNQERQVQQRNCYQLNVSGSVMTFATAYSKDILLAEIGLKPKGYIVTDEDIERMLYRADMIAVGMCEKIQPTLVP